MTGKGAMRSGVGLTTAAWAVDHGALRAYVQAAEELGYDQFGVASHVNGVDHRKLPDVPRGPFDHAGLLG